MSAPRDISDLKARLRRQPAATPVPPPAPVPAPSGVVEDPAQVSTDGGKTWAEAPAPPTLGTNGPQPAAPAAPAAARGAALLEAAAAFTRLALAELEGKSVSPDQVGEACARVTWVLLGDRPSPVDVAVACVRVLGAVRPATGRIEVIASKDGHLSVDVRVVEIPEGGSPWKGVYPPVSDPYLPEGDPRRGWHVIEKSEFQRGEVHITLRLPTRAATPEEIAEEQRSMAEEGR